MAQRPFEERYIAPLQPSIQGLREPDEGTEDQAEESGDGASAAPEERSYPGDAAGKASERRGGGVHSLARAATGDQHRYHRQANEQRQDVPVGDGESLVAE